MEQSTVREIFYYKHHYLDFFESLTPAVQRKFNWTLQLIATTERIPSTYFNHITNSSGLYEVRVEVNSNIYRVFSFFDRGNVLILLNGFKKKTWKTPGNEIKLSERLKKQYFDEKPIR